jgi:antitoxin (DNA-binding transcriptional repressor) of toxin-antitoxin stability system
MAEPATPLPHPRLELSLVEARTRFVQLARLAGLTQQTTIVTEDGRPLAAIVPIGATRPEAQRSEPPRSLSQRPEPQRSLSHRPERPESERSESERSEPERPNAAAAGWIRRIDKLRAEFRRQHVGLEQALEDAWRELDRVRPPGTDNDIDTLRMTHADLRRPRASG